MAIGRRRRSYFRFTEKTHSKKGIIAFTTAVLLILLYWILVGMAYKNGGTLSMYFGSVGVLAFLFSVVVLVLAIQSVKEENSFQMFPRLALFASLMSLLDWGGTYAIGFFLS